MPSDEKVEKVARAIPDEAVEKALLVFYGGKLAVEEMWRINGEDLRPAMRAAIEAALAAMGEREVVQPLALNDPADDEAARWVMAKLHGIRRDSGTIEYTLAAVIRAYQAGKASAASPRHEAVGEAVKAEMAQPTNEKGAG